MPLEDQELTLDRLASGDRPSILALGVSGAESLKRTKMAVFMVDVLGRVQIMAPSAVSVLAPPRVSDEELDSYDEERAINVMVAQNDSEEVILTYLSSRKGRRVSGDQDL